MRCQILFASGRIRQWWPGFSSGSRWDRDKGDSKKRNESNETQRSHSSTGLFVAKWNRPVQLEDARGETWNFWSELISRNVWVTLNYPEVELTQSYTLITTPTSMNANVIPSRAELLTIASTRVRIGVTNTRLTSSWSSNEHTTNKIIHETTNTRDRLDQSEERFGAWVSIVDILSPMNDDCWVTLRLH